MSKKPPHHWWQRLHGISIWLPLALFLSSGVIFIFALRQNNLTMIKLRDAVLQADKDNGDVETALKELQQYVTTHMNTNLSVGANPIESEAPIQLTNRYNQAVAAEEARVTAERERIAAEAQRICEQQFPNPPLSARAACNASYKEAHPVTERTVPKDFYVFDFASPSWSPDLAGWSLLATITAGIVLVARLLAGLIVGNYLRSTQGD